MKNILILIVLVYFTSCNNNAWDEKTQQHIDSLNVVSKAQNDTSFLFVRRILNCRSDEVNSIIGKPVSELKKSTDCDYMPDCIEGSYNYNGRKVEVTYYKNIVKCVYIKDVSLDQGRVLGYLGFPNQQPTFSNKFAISFRGVLTKGIATGPLIAIEGIREAGYILDQSSVFINIESYYDKKF